MGRRRTILVSLLAIVILGAAGLALFVRNRQASCSAVPLLNQDLLPNANLMPGSDPKMPAGWNKAANGVELRDASAGFEYDHDGRALQLIGIGNYAQTPAINVQPDQSYCFIGRALTDSDKHSPTKVRVVFDWHDTQGRTLTADTTDWQPVVLWQPQAVPSDWSAISAAFAAPAGAATLQIQVQPASDDRVYLDAMHVRWTTDDRRPTTDDQSSASRLPPPVAINPWPNGYRAAISFSFDWETAMGGLIHSRSIDDPNANQDPIARGLRMREGITTTLDLFRPHGIRATYYATGYNFLLGNRARRQFMGNPTFTWADNTNSHKWPNDFWGKTPWFSEDPYGTLQSDPAWYFGDLIARLQAEKQDIQSHTFSHFDGGLASTAQWHDDIAAWQAIAAERDVPSARSLAFPWSSSAGLSYNDWDAIQAAGITSVTRTNWTQEQYDLFQRNKQGVPALFKCRSIPGHERILACPDFNLNSQGTAAQALKLIDNTIAVSGTIDLWAHTEEVTSADQIAAWGQVVEYAAKQRDAGTLWVAPLAEITDWQAAVAECNIENVELKNDSATNSLTFKITNTSQRDLNGLTLSLPFRPAKALIDGHIFNVQFSIFNSLPLNIKSGQTLEVQIWPA